MNDEAPLERVLELLREGPKVTNLGIGDFAESLTAQDVSVVHVDWVPHPKLDADLAALLEQLE